MIDLQKIKKRLAEELSNSGMSQQVLANKIGVKQQTISHYLKGDRVPSLDVFANLCVMLDLDANEILCIK